jgi:hypothetical protein
VALLPWFSSPTTSSLGSLASPAGTAGLDPVTAQLLQRLGLLPGGTAAIVPSRSTPGAAPSAPAGDSTVLNSLSPSATGGDSGTPASPDASGGSLATNDPGAANTLASVLSAIGSPGKALSSTVGNPGSFNVMGQTVDPFAMAANKALGMFTGAIPGFGFGQQLASLLSSMISSDLTSMGHTPNAFGMQGPDAPMSPAQAVHNAFLQALANPNNINSPNPMNPGVGLNATQAAAVAQGGVVNSDNPYGGFRGLTQNQIDQNIAGRRGGGEEPDSPGPPGISADPEGNPGFPGEGNGPGPGGTGASPGPGGDTGSPGGVGEGGVGGAPGGGDSGD